MTLWNTEHAPREDGLDWLVTRDGKFVSCFDDRADAWKFCTRKAIQEGGGEVALYDEGGSETLRSYYTVQRQVASRE